MKRNAETIRRESNVASSIPEGGRTTHYSMPTALHISHHNRSNTVKILSTLIAAASMFTATSAFAGPPVTVTFKNIGTTTANYTIISSNETSTYVNASPKPAATVAAAGTNVYSVTSLISPDVNYANVRYKIGTKECVFSTTFVNALQPGGSKIPQWNKTATPSGGAICTATITSINVATYAWTVSFTMK
jgi:hypothetical protein